MSKTAPSSLPQGLVTFLFTDVAGSTRLWEDAPDAMRQAMIDHDRLIEAAVTAHHGQLVRPRGEGDSRFAVFSRASDALAAATDMQRQLQDHSWPTPRPIAVRASVHTGEADLRDGDYYGRSVNRAARLRAAGHAGQVLVSGATYDVTQDTVPDGIGLRPLGTVELADLERPEPVYQIEHPDLPSEFPRLRSSARPIVKLPALASGFLGREMLVEGIAERLTAGQSRLLTLTGPGGVGKTQVAVATALLVREQFPGGVFFVSLADVTTSDGALYALSAAVEVRETNDESLTHTIRRSLSTAPVLLVLDNGEQVAGLDGLVAELLAGSQQLAIVATSRSPLRLRAEQRIAVPPLEIPPPDLESPLTVASAREYPAIKLFLQRATAVDPYFELTQDSLPPVLEICRRLDGSPLSLELAAARADILEVSEIEERLSAQLTLLASEQADLPPRQRTARATVEWSISLLRSDVRDLLFRLCQLVGPFTLHDVAAFNSGGDDAVDLAELVDSSLVQASRTPTGRHFRIAETVREYSRTALSHSELEATQLQLTRHLADLAQRWGPTLHTADAATGIIEISRRYEDIRGVIAWALDESRAQDVASLLGALRQYWVYAGQLREPRAWLTRWLELDSSLGPDRPRLKLAAGILCYLLDEPRTATELLQASITDASSDSAALAYGYLGAVRLGEGDLEGAAELAAACEDQLGSADYEARSLALSLRAVIAAVTGDTAAEREYYRRRLEGARRQGDRRRVAETLNNLAEVCLADEDLSSAQVYAEEALASARESGRIVTRDALYTRARLDLLRENAPSAIVHARESLHISLDLGQRFEISQGISLLGAIAVALGRVREGSELMSAGQHMRFEGGAPLDVDLEPELDHYRQQAATELGPDTQQAIVGRAESLPLDAVVQLATGILPTR